MSNGTNIQIGKLLAKFGFSRVKKTVNVGIRGREIGQSARYENGDTDSVSIDLINLTWRMFVDGQRFDGSGIEALKERLES